MLDMSLTIHGCSAHMSSPPMKLHIYKDIYYIKHITYLGPEGILELYCRTKKLKSEITEKYMIKNKICDLIL